MSHTQPCTFPPVPVLSAPMNDARPIEEMTHIGQRTDVAVGTERLPFAPDRELASLFSLLDDPDPRISEPVIERIRKRGQDVILPLQSFLAVTTDTLARTRAEQISAEFNT